MIKNLAVENFYSVKDRQELSFEVSSKDRLDESSFCSEAGTSLNAVSCIIGANACGKTNLLRALHFLLWFMEDSYYQLETEEEIPFYQHALGQDALTKLEIEFEKSNKRYLYKVELSDNEVRKEYLGIKKVKGYSRLYEMTRSEGNIDFKIQDLPTLNSGDKARFEKRTNISLFSFLLSTGHLPAVGIKKVAENFYSNVTNLGNTQHSMKGIFYNVSKRLFDDEPLRKEVLSSIKDFDLGISDFNFEDASFSVVDSTAEKKTKELSFKGLNCVHSNQEESFKLPFFFESGGTQTAFNLIVHIWEALQKGGLIVYDEIESSLHPFIIKKIICLFESYETNPGKAQLIFSTHQHLLLNDRTKTQVFLVEKEKSLYTEVWRLDQVEGIRNDENYFAKYMAGNYGAIPEIKWL